MNTEKVSEITDIAESTVRKYAVILDIPYLGTGYRKIYDWKKSDIDRLKKAYKGRTGRPKKDKK